MARRRMIDPAFWDDPGIGSLSVHARLLFISLISSADDEGRLEADGPSLRRTAFGFDDFTVAQVEGWLAEISSKLRSVVVYRRDGRRYVQLVNWRVFQAIDRPKASRLPAPDSDGATTEQLSFDDESTIDRRLIDDGSFLKERKGKEEKGREARATDRRESAEGTSDLYDAVLAAMMLDHNCSQKSWAGVQRVVARFAADGRTPDFVRRQAEWFTSTHWPGKVPGADHLIDTAVQFAAIGNGSKPKPKPEPKPLTPEQIEKRDRGLRERQALAKAQMERFKANQ